MGCCYCFMVNEVVHFLGPIDMKLQEPTWCLLGVCSRFWKPAYTDLNGEWGTRDRGNLVSSLAPQRFNTPSVRWQCALNYHTAYLPRGVHALSRSLAEYRFFRRFPRCTTAVKIPSFNMLVALAVALLIMSADCTIKTICQSPTFCMQWALHMGKKFFLELFFCGVVVFAVDGPRL
jgi:hypothetical protein